MNFRDLFTAKAVASVYNSVASNDIPYLGEGLFPSDKKVSMELKWFKGTKGLPVSLMPSALDTVSTIRSRKGFEMTSTEMGYFKESAIVKEDDIKLMQIIQDSAEPYAQEIMGRIYNDPEELLRGAEVVPERMRMSLLSSAKDYAGSPKISIAGDGATYEYNYDPSGDYAQNNYLALSGTSAWTDTVNSDPIADVDSACEKVADASGVRPTGMIISKRTMNLLKQNAKVRNYILAQNQTATIVVTDARVKELFASELGVAIIVYTKRYIDESGVAHNFFPDGVATLIPDGALGKTWFAQTPDERVLIGNPAYDCAIVGKGVAVTVTDSNDPVQTKTTVSEIVLPSFERISETFQIKCY